MKYMYMPALLCLKYLQSFNMAMYIARYTYISQSQFISTHQGCRQLFMTGGGGGGANKVKT